MNESVNECKHGGSFTKGVKCKSVFAKMMLCLGKAFLAGEMAAAKHNGEQGDRSHIDGSKLR